MLEKPWIKYSGLRKPVKTFSALQFTGHWWIVDVIIKKSIVNKIYTNTNSLLELSANTNSAIILCNKVFMLMLKLKVSRNSGSDSSGNLSRRWEPIPPPPQKCQMCQWRGGGEWKQAELPFWVELHFVYLYIPTPLPLFLSLFHFISFTFLIFFSSQILHKFYSSATFTLTTTSPAVVTAEIVLKTGENYCP